MADPRKRLAPAHLRPKGPGRRFWVEIQRDFELDPAEERLLDQAATALDRAAAAREAIDREGIVITGPQGGIYPNPACSVERAAVRSFQSCLRQLGLEPEPTQARDRRGHFTRIVGGRNGEATTA